MTDLRMNERALTLVDSCIARATELRVAVQTLANGARIVDAGIGVPGGLGAGRALAEMCMGGLGHVAFTSLTIDDDTWPGVQVWTDHPAESCMASLRRLGDRPCGLLCDGIGSSAGQSSRRKRTVRKAWLR